MNTKDKYTLIGGGLGTVGGALIGNMRGKAIARKKALESGMDPNSPEFKKLMQDHQRSNAIKGGALGALGGAVAGRAVGKKVGEAKAYKSAYGRAKIMNHVLYDRLQVSRAATSRAVERANNADARSRKLIKRHRILGFGLGKGK